MNQINTLCVVDDDYTYQFLTQEIIEGTNLVKNIRICSNGREAIEFLESVKDKPEELPEILLLDLFMPVMDGWGFLKEYIRLKPRLGKKITIYVVSSSINPADIERAESISEVTDYIIKPVSEERFEEMVKGL